MLIKVERLWKLYVVLVLFVRSFITQRLSLIKNLVLTQLI